MSNAKGAPAHEIFLTGPSFWEDEDQAASASTVRELAAGVGLDAIITGQDATERAEWRRATLGNAPQAFLYIIGAGVATVWLRAAAGFGKVLGEELGKRVAKRIKNFPQHERHRPIMVVVRDPALKVEILICGHEPDAAYEELGDLIASGRITELGGPSGRIIYDGHEGRGWTALYYTLEWDRLPKHRKQI